MSNLTQLRICAEKPLPQEEHILKSLSDKSNSKAHYIKLSAAFFSQKIWPKDSVVTISFVASPNDIKNVDWTPIAVLKGLKNNDGSPVKLDPIEDQIRELSPIEAVKKIVRDRIQPLVGVKFKFVDQGGNVRISFDPHGGSCSLIGTDCLKSNEKSTMNFGWLDAGTIIHEFGHVLGLIHEHQNPKGQKIPWNDAKVYEWAKQTQGWDQQTTYHNIIERYDVNQINGSDFDSKSIMLYFFPPELTTDNKGTNQNHILSQTDISYIEKVYPGSDTSVSDFYENIYHKTSTPSNFKWKWKVIISIIASIIVIVLSCVIISYLVRKNKSVFQHTNYLDWKKSYSISKNTYTPS